MSNATPTGVNEIRIRWTVTDEDIAEGCPKLATACPVWRAVVRDYEPPKGYTFMAGTATLCLIHDNTSAKDILCTTPQLVARWMQAFDNEEDVYPFSGWATLEDREKGGWR